MNSEPQVTEATYRLPPWMHFIIGIAVWLAILLGKATLGILVWNALTPWTVEITLGRVVATALLMLYVEMLFASRYEKKQQE